MKVLLEKWINYLLYFFVFIFSWQTKLIIIPASTNYNEISLYLNYLALVLFLIIVIFYFFKFNYQNFKDNFSFSSYLWALIALDFFIFFSIIASLNKSVSIYKYLLFILVIVSFFFLVEIKNKFNFKKILLSFLLGLSLQAVLGIFQFFSQIAIKSKYFGLALHDASVLGASVIESSGGRFIRSYGGLDHPNIFGALMFFAIIFTIFFILNYQQKLYQKILSYFSLLLFSLALIVSFSRSAFLALVLALSSLFLFFLFFKNKILFKRYLFLITILFVFFISFFIILKPLFLSRLDTGSRLEQISLNERGSQLNQATFIIKDNLYLGTGIGAYHQKLLDLNPSLQAYQAQPVHNVFLLVLAETGLWSFLFFIFFLFFLIKKNSKNIFAVVIFMGLFVFMFFDHWLWSLPFGLLFLFFILSLTFYFSDFSDQK